MSYLNFFTKTLNMNLHELLDYLGTLNEEDRLIEIESVADLVYSDKFISLIKGQLQFAAKEMAGAGYFDKVYNGENSEILKKIQSEFREQSTKYRRVWISMIKLNKGFGFRNVDKQDLPKHGVVQPEDENLFDFDYCLICGISGGSDALCSKCIVDWSWHQILFLIKHI